jgi:hypothetical protein
LVTLGHCAAANGLALAGQWTREDEACHRRPKGHAALSRSTSDKPPALPDMATSTYPAIKNAFLFL